MSVLSGGAAVAAADTAAPVLSEFDFTPKAVDVAGGSKTVTVTARVTDETGTEAPVMLIGSDTTTQTAGFGRMALTSGTTQDGVWSRTVTIPATAAPGSWTVKIYPLDDTVGNGETGFHHHPTKLAVTNDPADTAAPVLSEFDFTPKSVDVAGGSQTVTVTARVTDATGAKAPTMLISSDGTTQSEGFGTMSRVSGTATDGVYQRTVTIPTTAAPGSWTVKIYPLDDTLGNDDGTFHNHPTKLAVTNGPVATAPAAPTEVSAIGGDQSAQVSWTAPAANGSPITGYTVTSSPGGLTTTVAGDQTAGIVTGLTNGTAYTFTVKATNSVGASPASVASAPVTPAAVPAAPTGVSAIGGDQSAQVSWTAPAANGSPITGYTITSSPGGLTTTVAGDQTAGIVTGLTNGTAYTFTVKATNSVGASPASVASAPVTPAAVPEVTAPDAPTAVQAIRGNGTATLSWSVPAENGSPITSYTVTATPGGRTLTVPGDTTSATITGLTNGTAYTFTVTAANAAGTSSASTPSAAVTPATVPGRVAKPTVKVDGRKAIIKWSVPNDGGSPLTGYRVTVDGKTRTIGADVRKLVLKRLKPGRYKVKVAAVNAVGAGAASDLARFRIRAA